MARILVIGGAGFVGSHVTLALLRAGYEVHVVDDLSNSRGEVLTRLRGLAGVPFHFTRADMRDTRTLTDALRGSPIEAALMLAGRKSPLESISRPALYYNVNIGGAAATLELLRELGTRTLIFSSSATVYKGGQKSPLDESALAEPCNPYGDTKLAIERMLDSLCGTGEGWKAMSLRYFNPVGAHPSGQIGDDPEGSSGNLFPAIAEVATGRRSSLRIYGNDYDTPDGTGVRDYIHVMDLADAHISALNRLADAEANVHFKVNIGTGRGYSVLEAVEAWSRACGTAIGYEFAKRRPGDLGEVYANPALARTLLKWTATRDLDAMCADAWRFWKLNPKGVR
jgi:UDP-glucose 4-epimerase